MYAIRSYYVFEEPKEDEVPPTMLENGMLGAPGEELVKFYQVPSYRMWDPSTVIFLSFALFFSMIVSDFGYGVVFSLITALTWNKMRASETARRIRITSYNVCYTKLLREAPV